MLVMLGHGIVSSALFISVGIFMIDIKLII